METGRVDPPPWQWRPLDTSVVGDVTARRSKYMPHCRESQPVPVKDRNHNHGPSSATAIPVGLQSGKQHPSPSTHKALCEVDILVWYPSPWRSGIDDGNQTIDIYAPQDIICLDDSPGSGAHGEEDRYIKEQTSNIPTVERDSTTPGHLAPVPHLQQVSGERAMNPHCSVSHIDTHPNKSSDSQPDVTESRNSTQSFLCMGRASHQTCIVKKNF